MRGLFFPIPLSRVFFFLFFFFPIELARLLGPGAISLECAVLRAWRSENQLVIRAIRLQKGRRLNRKAVLPHNFWSAAFRSLLDDKHTKRSAYVDRAKLAAFASPYRIVQC